MSIKHRRTSPYTPGNKGKAERFIQTALRESATQNTGQTPTKEMLICSLGSTTSTANDPW